MSPDDLNELRRQARLLLDLQSPADGLAAYYALYHNPARTRLLVEPGPTAQVEGFLAICQTGRDLFRPLAVVRARRIETAATLLRRGCQPRRPYYLVVPPHLQTAAEAALEVERMETHHIYRLDLRRYTPSINVMVTPAPAADGSPRFVIRHEERIVAEAGVNWRSPHFAELYVWTDPQVHRRGWGKAVANSCVAWIVRSGVQPLYVAAEENEPAIQLATSLGFVNSGEREVTVEGVGRT